MYPNIRTKVLKLKSGESATKEEEQALRVAPVEANKSDYSLVQMSVPDWFCPVVCADLDLDELIPKSPKFNTIKMAKEAKKFRFAEKKKKKKKENNLKIDNFEENNAINTENNLNFDGYENDYNYDLELQNPCMGMLPSGLTCLKSGLEISSWFMQRALNPGLLCN